MPIWFLKHLFANLVVHTSNLKFLLLKNIKIYESYTPTVFLIVMKRHLLNTVLISKLFFYRYDREFLLPKNEIMQGSRPKLDRITVLLYVSKSCIIKNPLFIGK